MWGDEMTKPVLAGRPMHTPKCQLGTKWDARRGHKVSAIALAWLGSVAVIGSTSPALAQQGSGFSASLDGNPVKSRDGKLIVAETPAIQPSDPITVSSAPKGPGRAGSRSVLPHMPGYAEADIDVRFDGLDVKPVLNVTTTDLRHAYKAGDLVEFKTSTNYPGFIARAELRILAKRGDALIGTLATVPVDANGTALWTMPHPGSDIADTSTFEYVLRVYDEHDRHDETKPLQLERTDVDRPDHALSAQPDPSSDRAANLAGESLDRTAYRNIPVHGGAVTVSGRQVPTGHDVQVMGERVAVDSSAAFVIQRILPAGEHDVDVRVGSDEPDATTLIRPINIPANDWFFVGLADLTLHQRMASDDWQAATGSDKDAVEATGRLGFYLKGRIRGRYLLTASADTSEDKLDRLFSNLGRRDSQSLLRRIDPDAWYPVYGDDSTRTEDAPTSGKFYVRLERGESHVMWGDFRSQMTGAGLVRNERNLYGAQLVYKSEAATTFGAPRLAATAHAAQAGTLPRRDVFRGTGGSSYFLSRQDIVAGSETVTITVTDPDSGRVMQRKVLTRAVDYEIDHVQGIILLREPLSSGVAGAGLVRDDALGRDAVSLTVHYEYDAGTTDLESWSYGGRAEAWLNERLRIGVAGHEDATSNGDRHAMAGVDARLRLSDRSWIEAAYARSNGLGTNQTYSIDGGVTGTDVNSVVGDTSGSAFTIRGELDLADIDERIKGRIGAHFERREDGFADLDGRTDVGLTSYGGYGEIDVTADTRVRLAHDHVAHDDGRHKSETEIDVTHRINQAWTAEVGLRETSKRDVADAQVGRRLDGAARLTFKPGDDLSLYAFGQATLDHSGTIDRNDRYGVGTSIRVSEKIALNAEISHGTAGIGALAGIEYAPTANDRYYVSYALDPDLLSPLDTSAGGRDLGGLTFGASKRYNDTLTTFAESRYDMLERRRSLASTYGMTWTPDPRWTWTGGIETGLVQDPIAGDTNRQAYSLGVSYKDDDRIAWRLKGEIRNDHVADPLDATRGNGQAYLFVGGLKVALSPDWRLLGDVDAAFAESDTTGSSFGDRHYVKASAGLAYRPVENDRFSLLARFTYLADLYARNSNWDPDEAVRPMQRNSIFSIDANYQVTKKLTIGGKYGFRFGEIALPTLTAGTGDTLTFGDFTTSSAHIGILRADIHVVKRWDLLLEGRALWLPEASQVDYGALAAIYRHVGDTLKIGVGYNFGRFSDDLSDLVADDHGFFVNVTGKF